MVEFTTDWLSYQQRDLEATLAPFVGKPDLRMLEIGAYEGRSTIWFLTYVLIGKGCHLTTIDTWCGSAEHDQSQMGAVYDRFRRNTSRYVAEGKLTVLVGRSQPYLAAAVAAQLHGGNGPGYDIAYVDGSHAAPDVLSDAVLSWAVLNPGGVLIFDDYDWRNAPREEDRPRIAIDAFLACFRGQYTELQRGYRIAIRKHG